MKRDKTLSLITPVNVPRYGTCSGCGKKFQLGGSNTLGYKVPAHHASDVRMARRGDYCPGSDRAPRAVL
jgi:transposase-like protein